MKSYQITDPSFYHDLKSFEAYLYSAFRQHHPDFVSFRDKVNTDIFPYAVRFLEIAKACGIRLTLINHEIALATQLGFWGVHLRSTQLSRIKTAKAEGLFTIVSTHTLEEARQAKAQGADAVTISPVFDSPGKGPAKGVAYLCDFVKALPDTAVFALGGIVDDTQIAKIAPCKPYGFASIRYFV